MALTVLGSNHRFDFLLSCSNNAALDSGQFITVPLTRFLIQELLTAIRFVPAKNSADIKFRRLSGAPATGVFFWGWAMRSKLC